MDDDEFSALVRDQTLKAFGLQAWQIGLAPAPWHVRLLAPFRWRWWWWRVRRTWFRLTCREAADDE